MSESPIRVLLVEDDPADVRLIREYLQAVDDAHYPLAHAASLQEAEAHLRGDAPTDVVLLDLSLPDSAGLDTIRRVLGAAPGIPVVVLTGIADRRLPVEALRAGAQDFLPKDEMTGSTLERVLRYATERGLVERARRAAAETAERREHLLAEAGRVLIGSLDEAARLRELAEVAVPALADLCVIDLLKEDGSIERATMVAADPRKEAIALEMLARYPDHGTSDRHPLREILRSGKSVLGEITDAMLQRVARDEGHLALHRQLGPVFTMTVPIVAHEQTLGAISFTSAESGRRFDAEDLALAEALGKRAALAVQNARLYRLAQEARARVVRLQEVTAALSETMSPNTVAEVMVRQGLEALGAAGGGWRRCRRTAPPSSCWAWRAFPTGPGSGGPPSRREPGCRWPRPRGRESWWSWGKRR